MAIAALSHECLPGKKVKKAKVSSDGRKESGAMESSEEVLVPTASDGKNSGNARVCLSEGERFRALFVGPHFVVGNAYFDKVDKASKSLFEHHTWAR